MFYDRMTNQHLIEVLMTQDLNAFVEIDETRYCGGGDERYSTEFSVFLRDDGTICLVPRCDTQGTMAWLLGDGSTCLYDSWKE